MLCVDVLCIVLCSNQSYSHLSCWEGDVVVLEEQDLAAEFAETSVGLKLAERIIKSLKV